MPNSTHHRPRPRAPYAVYLGADFLFLAAGLPQLHDLLRDHEAASATRQQEAQARRNRAADRGAPWYELPGSPRISVIDNRGEHRPDLASSWSIRFHCSPRGRTVDRLVDYPWDGDIRPRGAPVPGTGVRCRYGRMYYRYPRTQRDRRLGYPMTEDGEPVVRGGRRPCAIPNAWDDLPRRGHEDRSWKRFRGTQWVGR